jgi:hypothetical protein
VPTQTTTDARRFVWWTRVDRAAKRRGNAGAKLRTEWSHAIMETRCAEALEFELVDGGWRPFPPERFTEEYMQRECRRLHDELGAKLGVGPMPR